MEMKSRYINNEDLRRCPFCGNKHMSSLDNDPEKPWAFSIHCSRCGLLARFYNWEGSRADPVSAKETVKSWNTRT